MTPATLCRAAVLAVAAGCATAAGAADADADWRDAIDNRGSLRADGWSGSRQLDDAGAIGAASLWDRLRWDGAGAGQAVASGWLRAETSGAAGSPTPPHARLRELYWRGDLGPLDLTVGRQMPAWGRADGLNPTDQLSPRDFTLLAPEDGDLRHGNQAIRLAWNHDSLGEFSAMWFPKGASHRMPLQRRPGLDYRRDPLPGGSQTALKWEFAGAGSDGSLSWFDGIDPMPDLVPGSLSASGLTVAERNARERVLGADFSAAGDGVVWRAEAAWTRTPSQGGEDFTHKKPQLWMVAGPEWSLGEWTLGTQLTLRRVFGWRSPDGIADPIAREVARAQSALSNQVSATQTGFTVRLARRAFNDTLLAETSAVVLRAGPPGDNSQALSGLWRGKLDWAVDDHWNLAAGFDHPFGPGVSFFGLLRDNRVAYVQLRRSL
ncbi:hypothetical protein [Derxia lacustris]|uniref:hypothetical protein n=1 Tax=Derxia lacustris TaxID=764842 RepID=UPI00111C83EC|nr:hypothetical protein [Derxia lacustris]